MEENNKPSQWALSLRIVSDFGFTIAVPIVVLAWIGKLIDTHYQTKPVFIIIGFVLAAGLSGFMIYRKAKYYAQLYKNM